MLGSGVDYLALVETLHDLSLVEAVLQDKWHELPRNAVADHGRYVGSPVPKNVASIATILKLCNNVYNNRPSVQVVH